MLLTAGRLNGSERAEPWDLPWVTQKLGRSSSDRQRDESPPNNNF